MDVFINDAFGISHRHDASSVGICEHVPRLFPGLLMRAELQRLLSCLDPPKRHAYRFSGFRIVKFMVDYGFLWVSSPAYL